MTDAERMLSLAKRQRGMTRPALIDDLDEPRLLSDRHYCRDMKHDIGDLLSKDQRSFLDTCDRAHGSAYMARAWIEERRMSPTPEMEAYWRCIMADRDRASRARMPIDYSVNRGMQQYSILGTRGD